ncbi:MAG: hypothetical protein LBO71_08845 [Prevotellaceae bacterium]|jgi:hypothetical protein|nr:hypothetical protein [Prevotellaceae bacterium]
MKPANLPPLPKPVIIPGIMQLLREIRDKNSLRHMNMTPRELLEELEQQRSEYFLVGGRHEMRQFSLLNIVE